MAFTQAVPKDVRLGKDGSVSLVLVYSGEGEESTEEPITLPTGSVLDAVTLRKEAIRRVSNRNASRDFELFLKQIQDQPIDLSKPDDPEDVVTLQTFAVLRGRERDLAASAAAGCASQEQHQAALADLHAAYAEAKNDALRVKMDTFLR